MLETGSFTGNPRPDGTGSLTSRVAESLSGLRLGGAVRLAARRPERPGVPAVPSLVQVAPDGRVHSATTAAVGVVVVVVVSIVVVDWNALKKEGVHEE